MEPIQVSQMSPQEFLPSTATNMATFGDVDRLQMELSDALALRSALESEVHQLVQSISQGPSGALSVLPTELLVEIFQSILQENPVEIHRLPLVCRAWSLVIQETPQLWTNIRITVPIEPRMVKECAAYCSMVIERSARCPLDISIDYSKLETSRKSLENSIETRERDLSKPTRGLKSLILRRGEGGDPLYKYYIDRYLEPLKRLSGDNFSGLERWRSFELLCGSLFYHLPLPDEAFNASIFAGSTPLLESLKLSYSSKWILEGEERNYGSGWEKNMPRPFPFSPNLHEIVLSNVSMPISIHSIEPLKVRRLRMSYCDMEQFQFTLRCQNLTHLYMGYTSRTKESIRQSLAPGSLLFPHLVHLDLAISVPRWFFGSMVAPLLDSVSFVTDGAFAAIKGMILPASVTKVECRWPFYYNWDETLAAGLSAVVRSPSVTTILCAVRYQREAEKALKYLSSTGFNSPTLVILPFYNSSEAEALEIVDLQERL
jgi:F-box-like